MSEETLIELERLNEQLDADRRLADKALRGLHKLHLIEPDLKVSHLIGLLIIAECITSESRAERVRQVILSCIQREGLGLKVVNQIVVCDYSIKLDVLEVCN